MKHKYKYLIGILFLLVCVLLFKNISYPLLWNDEADTAMAAKQILKYGYPKVHDGKNIIFLPSDTTWIGYKESWDANVAMAWGHFYFASIGVALSELVDDIYLKTALVRIPMALMGLLGLLFFGLSVKGFFTSQRAYEKFIIAFVFLELLSVSFFLHMREARYYSLVVFIGACFFYVFNNYHVARKYSFRKYMVLITIILFIAYQINFVIFVASGLFMVVYETWIRLGVLYQEGKGGKSFLPLLLKQIRLALRELLPLITGFVLVIPVMISFDLMDTGARAIETFGNDWTKYFRNLNIIFFVLSSQELLYAALFAKSVQLAIWWIRKHGRWKNVELDATDIQLEKLTFFCTLFFFCYVIVVAKLPFFWTRHYIILQPLLSLILVADIFIAFRYFSAITNRRRMLTVKIAFSLILLMTFSVVAEAKFGYIKKYIYQITNQYKGPLDVIIPHIKENYEHPEDLVIATNYEEFSYIFYLGSKVTMGFVNKNLEEDMRYQPDVIIYRKSWSHDPKYYRIFMQKARYSTKVFPVYDYYVNNIPELGGTIQHQFKTKLATNDYELTTLYERVR